MDPEPTERKVATTVTASVRHRSDSTSTLFTRHFNNGTRVRRKPIARPTLAPNYPQGYHHIYAAMLGNLAPCSMLWRKYPEVPVDLAFGWLVSAQNELKFGGTKVIASTTLSTQVGLPVPVLLP